jgi:hypothetical protein
MQTATRSWLTHDIGIQALGYVMDTLTENTPAEDLDTETIAAQLQVLDAHVTWCQGQMWQLPHGERRAWNRLQNTSSDIALLTDHLLRLVAPRTVRQARTWPHDPPAARHPDRCRRPTHHEGQMMITS